MSVAVVDFGGQYAHMIATKIRKLRVSAEIKQPTDPIESFRRYDGIVLSGSPSSVGNDVGEHLFQLNVPILGICYGHQFIIERHGGTVEHKLAEYGPAVLYTSDNRLLCGANRTVVWMSHGDTVTSLPIGFEAIGHTTIGNEINKFAAIANISKKLYGIQFHPEVDDTEKGDVILSNFVFRICGCRASFHLTDMVGSIVDKIASSVKGQIFVLASGGIDSTVCAMLAAKAVGRQRVKLTYIDNGFMRLNESAKVSEDFKKLGFNINTVDAASEFIKCIHGVIDPEEKRKAIGDVFVDILNKQLSALDNHTTVIQGTIYPDTIESGGTKGSDVIKTHHNRVSSIIKMIEEGRVIEPIRDLYKAEVRDIAKELGIPSHMINRHPFPGPGLSIRTLCSSGIITEQFKHTEKSISGENCCILPIKSVGVKGDSRCYEHPAVIWEMSQEKATDVAKSFYCLPGINRCLLSLTGAIKKCELIPSTVTIDRLNFLRRIDSIVSDIFSKYEIPIWQCPVVLLPIHVNDVQNESVVVRPVMSNRAMTAKPAEIPNEAIRMLCRQILATNKVSSIFLDVTPKPPSSIEFE